MAKIRHIAYRVDDAEAVAKFLIEGFEMRVAQRRGAGVIDLTDGTINVSLLPRNRPGSPAFERGIEHIGFTAKDNERAKKTLLAAGAAEMRTVQLGPVHYEMKFEGPEGMIVDIGEWAGTEPV